MPDKIWKDQEAIFLWSGIEMYFSNNMKIGVHFFFCICSTYVIEIVGMVLHFRLHCGASGLLLKFNIELQEREQEQKQKQEEQEEQGKQGEQEEQEEHEELYANG